MSRSDRITLAAGAGALILAVAAGWLVLAPPAAHPELMAIPSPGASGLMAGHGAGAAPATIVVDVEGAVANPGVQTLPAGSRVSDAIAAAGGYSASVDVAAAAAQINLAQPLADGEQIHVPIQGETLPGDAPAPGATDGAGSDGGLVDLNSASPEQLEALPGIGPVTVQKIVAARDQGPFSSLQDAVDRGVLNRGQLEEIQDLATAG
jgi:competence protein ComEA